MSRCDSAAMVAKTSELLPEPEMPVNTVSRRLGISTLMSLRLFTRAPCTRIRSWRSAPCGEGDGASVLVVVLIVGSYGNPQAVGFARYEALSDRVAADRTAVPADDAATAANRAC